MESSIVIVGAGQAGVQSAEALRSGGYGGRIVLVGDESIGPYHRPPLSKAWLAGEMDASQLVMRSPEMLARKGIDLRINSRVKSIDRIGQKVRLVDGSDLPYSGLVLATGSTPRNLSLPGSDARGILPLRSLPNASAIALNAAYTQVWSPHHALADARALMAGYRAWCAHRENSELPPPFIHDIVQSIDEIKAGQLAPYKFGNEP